MITNLQANVLDPKGDPAKKAQAQQALQRVQQVAATDPAAAQVLTAANQAVKNATIAYHVKDTAQRAAAGDTTAQGNINQMVSAAERGDPAAKSTFEVLAATFAQEAMKSEQGAKLWERLTGRGPGTLSPTTASGQWYDVVGASALDQIRELARAEANKKPGNAAVAILTARGRVVARGFPSLDAAIDWLQRVSSRRERFTYAAAYEKAADGTAYIQAEEFGGATAPVPAPTPIPRESPATTGWW